MTDVARASVCVPCALRGGRVSGLGGQQVAGRVCRAQKETAGRAGGHVRPLPPPRPSPGQTRGRAHTGRVKKHLFTVKAQPWCSARQTPRSGRREAGAVSPSCRTPALLLSACPPVHAAGGGHHLAPGTGRRRWSSSSSRWSARFTAACNAHAPRSGPGRPSRPPQAAAAGLTSCCRRRLLTASSFFARATFTLQGTHSGVLWGAPPAPDPPMAPSAGVWLAGTPTPTRKGGAAVLPGFQSRRGHWAAWRVHARSCGPAARPRPLPREPASTRARPAAGTLA